MLGMRTMVNKIVRKAIQPLAIGLVALILGRFSIFSLIFFRVRIIPTNGWVLCEIPPCEFIRKLITQNCANNEFQQVNEGIGPVSFFVLLAWSITNYDCLVCSIFPRERKNIIVRNTAEFQKCHGARHFFRLRTRIIVLTPVQTISIFQLFSFHEKALPVIRVGSTFHPGFITIINCGSTGKPNEQDRRAEFFRTLLFSKEKTRSVIRGFPTVVHCIEFSGGKWSTQDWSFFGEKVLAFFLSVNRSKKSKCAPGNHQSVQMVLPDPRRQPSHISPNR